MNEKYVKVAVCANCGGHLDVDTGKEFMECPYCGTKYNVSDLLNESDAVRIEKIRQRSQKEAETERLKQEREAAAKNEAEEKKRAFKKSKFAKIQLVFMVICGVVCIGGFSGVNVIAGIIALLQVVLLIVARLMGTQVIKEPRKGTGTIAAVLAFLLIIPFVGTLSGASSLKGGGEKFDWKDIELCERLPEPESNVGDIFSNSETNLSMSINKTSQTQYKDYLEKCVEMGYTTEADKSDTSYSAYNAEGYELGLTYYESGKDMNVTLAAPPEMSENAWPSNSLSGLIPAPKSTLGRVEWENDNGFLYYAGSTSKDDFAAYVSEIQNAGFTVDYNKGDDFFYGKNTDGYKIDVRYQGNNIMKIRLEASKDDTQTAAQETGDEASDKAETDGSDSQSSGGGDAAGVSPEFKEALDSYEKFFDEYVAIMKKYKDSNGTDVSILADYAKYMGQYADMMQKLDAMDESDMNAAELAYYTEVHGRILKKLAEVAQ